MAMSSLNYTIENFYTIQYRISTIQYTISTVGKLPCTIQYKKSKKGKTNVLSLSQRKEKVKLKNYSYEKVISLINDTIIYLFGKRPGTNSQRGVPQTEKS